LQFNLTAFKISCRLSYISPWQIKPNSAAQVRNGSHIKREATCE